MLYLFFWIIPQCLNFVCRRFGTLLLHLHRPMKMERTVCSEMSAYKIQTPGNYPEESIQVSNSFQSNTDPGHHVTRVAEFYTKVPSISGYSVWNLLPITHLPPVILKQLLYFRKMRGPLLYAHVSHNYITHVT